MSEIRLTDEQWERIRNHFPEEHIADGRPGRNPASHQACRSALNITFRYSGLWSLNIGTSRLSGCPPSSCAPPYSDLRCPNSRPPTFKRIWGVMPYGALKLSM